MNDLARCIAAELLAQPEGQPPAPADLVALAERIVFRTLETVETIRWSLDGVADLAPLDGDLWAYCACCGAHWPKAEGEPDVMRECCVCAPPPPTHGQPLFGGQP